MRKTVFTLICCLFFCSVCSAVTRIAVFPVGFSDLDFTNDRTSLSSLCSNAESYFNNSFHGQETFQIILLQKRTTGKPYSYYGANSGAAKDCNFFEAVQEVCSKADKDTDFHDISHLCFITAGKSEADGFGENWFWPQQTNFPSGVSVTLDGKRFTSYGICTELGADGNISGHATLCHEICHLLGLPDLYDTDGERSGGKGRALDGYLSIMDRGDKTDGGKNPPLLGAIELDHLGYGIPLTANPGIVTLEPVENNGRFYKINITDKEFFLAENRKGKGLEIYFVNKSDREAGYSDYFKCTLTAARRWECNEINCNPEFQCASVINTYALPYGRSDWFDFGNSTAFREIRRNDSGDISFSIVNPVSVTCVNALQGNATVFWESDFRPEELESFVLELDGRKIQGEYGCFIVDGLASGQYYEGRIVVRHWDGSEFQCKCSFRTKFMYSGTIPFIYFPDEVKRTDTGSFVKSQTLNLSIFNNPGGNVSWYFDGKPIENPAQFPLSGSGVLTAVIYLEDGSHTVIKKAITVE